eukprot:3260792-Rhodomonas_salina.1
MEAASAGPRPLHDLCSTPSTRLPRCQHCTVHSLRPQCLRLRALPAPSLAADATLDAKDSVAPCESHMCSAICLTNRTPDASTHNPAPPFTSGDVVHISHQTRLRGVCWPFRCSETRSAVMKGQRCGRRGTLERSTPSNNRAC